MSQEAWEEFQEEVKAFEKRNWRQSGGRVGGSPSQDSPPKSKT